MPKGDRLKLKADPEDGTTPIANLLLEAVAMAKLSGLQKGAILYLWRRTYGWIDENGQRKKEDKIPLSEWKNALDSTAPRLSIILSELEDKGIIKRRIADIWGGYYYSINTDINKWNHASINISKLCEQANIPMFPTVTENVTITRTDTITVPVTIAPLGNSNDLDNTSPKKNGTVTENVTEQLPKTKLPTLYKEILNKDKEIYSHLFEYWNKKKIVVHKKETELINRRIKNALKDNSVVDIEKAIDNYDEVMKNPTRYYFNHKWAMDEFLQRGLGKFMDNTTPLENFLNSKRLTVNVLSDPDKFQKDKYGKFFQT